MRSDVRARAVRNGDQWGLNGEKWFTPPPYGVVTMMGSGNVPLPLPIVANSTRGAIPGAWALMCALMELIG